eukprot:13649773-Alexandrium_andersonii.AAC.1
MAMPPGGRDPVVRDGRKGGHPGTTCGTCCTFTSGSVRSHLPKRDGTGQRLGDPVVAALTLDGGHRLGRV